MLAAYGRQIKVTWCMVTGKINLRVIVGPLCDESPAAAVALVCMAVVEGD